MPLPPQRTPLWALPASSRPSRLLAAVLPALAFVVVFDAGILSTFVLIVLLLPLAYLPPTRLAYLRTGKAAFGRLLVLVVSWFSPTELVISAGEGVQREWVLHGEDGELVGVNLPAKGIWIANHTTLADWLYLWPFAYLSGHSPSLYIALKASLRRIPVIGWGCHLFGFAFLSRKWAADRAPFAAQLGRIARETNRGGEAERLALLLFPEGTIVTENTRGISKRFADKSGVADFKHLLLPRSTGLFFAPRLDSLRQLALSIPTLHLVDLTVGYPLPRTSSSTTPLYASDFYTLPSLLLQGVPPPELHLHVRAFPLARIPLGDLSAAGAGEGTAEERAAFDRWLRARWAEKDALLERFRKEGSFAPSRAAYDDDDDDRRAGESAWRIRLRSPALEALAAFAFFVPFLALFVAWRWRGALAGAVSAVLVGVVRGRTQADEDPILGRDCPCGRMGHADGAGKLAGEL
ncbi:hypothetical protein JCM10449v2_007062 [Rhodotorula kratochvilovae]